MFTGIFTRRTKTVASLGILVAALATVSLGGFTLATPAHAAPADPTPATPQFGLVDISRILRDAKMQQQSIADLTQMQKNLNSVLQRLDQGSARFLTAAELNELAGLYQKDKPVDADQKRIGQLEGKGDQLKREFSTLQSLPTPTDTQSARLGVLNDMQTQGSASLKALAGSLDNILRDKSQDADRKTLAAIRTSVNKVAKEKSLTAVFTSEVAIFANVDITDDVLKDLNK